MSDSENDDPYVNDSYEEDNERDNDSSINIDSPPILAHSDPEDDTDCDDYSDDTPPMTDCSDSDPYTTENPHSSPKDSSQNSRLKIFWLQTRSHL